MATDQPTPAVPVREHVEWALMYVVLGMALWTILSSLVVWMALFLGVF